jgi:hypothetical protein
MTVNDLTTIPWEHLLAELLLGVAGLVLILIGQSTAGVALLTLVAGYAFGVSFRPATSATTTNVSTVPSTKLSKWFPDNNSSEVLSLADEAYEELPTDNSDEYALG